MKINTLIKMTLVAASFMALATGCRHGTAGQDAAFDGIGDGAYLDMDASDMPLAATRFDMLPPVAKPANVVPVYFRYNDSGVQPQELGKIQTVATFLQQNPGVVVMIEGNCDERGTNEYNMSLGEYRAEAVRGSLVGYGIAADRIQTVSFGEERPADPGHNESAWSLNRRADFSFYRLR